MPEKVAEHLQLNHSPENSTYSKGAPIPQSFACLSQRGAEQAVPPWLASPVLLLAKEAVQAQLRAGRLWFLLLVSEQVEDEGKITWCVCKYSREEKTCGAGQRKVKLQVSEQGLGKAALSTLSLLSLSFMGYYLHF